MSPLKYLLQTMTDGMSITCALHVDLPTPSRAHNCDSRGASCLSLPLATRYELHEKSHRVNALLRHHIEPLLRHLYL